MSGRLWIIGSCVMLAGCNLLSGAADLATNDDAAPGAGGPGSSENDSGGGPGQNGDAATSADGAKTDAGSSDAKVMPSDGGFVRPDGGHFVFVTSTKSAGDLGGTNGADMSCNDVATAAGLGGTWVAWLTTASAMGTRLTFGGPWHLVTGERVAPLLATLTNQFGALDHAIDRDEKGALVGNGTAWTGSGFLGDCASWKSASSASSAIVGSTSATSPLWAGAAPSSCDTMHRLYCFEN